MKKLSTDEMDSFFVWKQIPKKIFYFHQSELL